MRDGSDGKYGNPGNGESATSDLLISSSELRRSMKTE
jgi:hypothetical protein